MKVREKRIALRRYIVPLGFLCCCLFFVGASSAKMRNESAITREGEVHVAEWNVDVTSSSSGNMALDAGSDSQTYSLLVTNNSEIKSTYSIKVSNIPDGVKVGLDISSSSDLVAPTDGKVVFTNTGGDLNFEPGSNTRTHALSLAADATADPTDDDVNMSIEVLFEQKDPSL